MFFIKFACALLSMHALYKFVCALLGMHALYKFVCAFLSFHALYLVYTRTTILSILLFI